MSTHKIDIKQLRQSHGISRVEMANKLLITPRTLANYEDKGSAPPYMMLLVEYIFSEIELSTQSDVTKMRKDLHYYKNLSELQQSRIRDLESEQRP